MTAVPPLVSYYNIATFFHGTPLYSLSLQAAWVAAVVRDISGTDKLGVRYVRIDSLNRVRVHDSSAISTPTISLCCVALGRRTVNLLIRRVFIAYMISDR